MHSTGDVAKLPFRVFQLIKKVLCDVTGLRESVPQFEVGIYILPEFSFPCLAWTKLILLYDLPYFSIC